MSTTPHPRAHAPSSTVPKGEKGYLLEARRIGPATDDDPDPVARHVTATPHEAIRTIRTQLHTGEPLGLSSHDLAHARRQAESEGWVHALAALHRDEPCGFLLGLRDGGQIEWHVRPLTYVTLGGV
ncbi:hypothetical protein ACPXCE_16690 [Streptomyces sp. DT24]|uniref:hypothetical protein n=1 Tax=Streptomyces sp. DT24 TaxID=3416520 RepID=UPI003CFB26B9